MDWLKDKKNQPIVAAIAAVVIVGVVAFIWFTMFKSAPQVDNSAGAMMPDESAPPPETAMPAAPAPAAQQAAAPPTGSANPMETYRADPFLPVGYKPPSKGPKPTPPIPDLPIFHFPPPLKPVKPELRPEPAQPVRRLAGVMLNGRVYAIIESNGASQVVQPGEPLNDGLATVERIEADKVILKTVSSAPRYLTIRLARSPRISTAEGGSPVTTSGPSPAQPYGSRRPGMYPSGSARPNIGGADGG